MSAPESELDKHLRALFSGLDASADFEVRLMARLRAEPHTDAPERAKRARQQERARYLSAVSELQSWRRSMLRILTLDTLGIAFLLTIGVVTSWPYIKDVFDVARQYAPHLAILVGILIAAVPVLAIWAEQPRRPIRVL